MCAKLAESWQQYRQRMLDETGRFIEWGLAHPDEVMWIPAKRIDRGGFPRAVAEWFWCTALSGDGDGGVLQRWRTRLTQVKRFIPRRG
ncbi:hypothetical protein LCGC14_1735360 [marine sediment metagenome]|uniref:Uncharacterized protein n=1 Tax=marine sediment metagenome TaxID=412755 RepID=A0A0F9H8B8_9ZZZZ